MIGSPTRVAIFQVLKDFDVLKEVSADKGTLDFGP